MATAQQLIDRAPPHDETAERGLLGCVLYKPSLIDDVASLVRPDEFYSAANRIIFAHMLAIVSDGKTIDVPLLLQRIEAASELRDISAEAYLLECLDGSPWADNAAWHARTIRERSIERELLHACLEGASLAGDRGTNSQDKLATVEQSVLAIAERRQTPQTVALSAALAEATEALDNRILHGAPSGLSTGIVAIDNRLGGLRPGELIILAGRPGSGKTSLGIGISTNAAKREASGVLFVSLEMSRRELAERMLSAESGVDGELIREGRLEASDRRKIVDAHADLHDLPIIIEDSPRRNVLDIVSTARRLKRQGAIKLLVVDYLSLIEADNQRDPRHEQVAKITRRLKTAARELQIPIVCLAQLNRELEKGNDHRPKLSHLRESGAIEQDADVVLFVHRPEMFKPDDADLRNKAEIIIAKNRNGATGIVPVLWDGPTTSFLPAAFGTRWEGLGD